MNIKFHFNIKLIKENSVFQKMAINADKGHILISFYHFWKDMDNLSML